MRPPLALGLLLASSAHAGLVFKAPAPPATVGALKAMARTDQGASFVAARPGIFSLARFEPESELHRTAIGQLGLRPDFARELEAAVASGDRRALHALMAELGTAYESGGGAAIDALVTERSLSILEAVKAGRMSLHDLGASSHELSVFAPVSPAAAQVQRVAAAAINEKAGVIADAILDALENGRVGLKTEAADAKRGDVALAKAIAGELKSTSDEELKLQAARRLEKLASLGDAEVQTIAARALVAELRDITRDDHRLAIGQLLKKLALQPGTTRSVQEIALSGLMEDVSQSTELSYAKNALSTVEALASNSSIRDVKALAISLLMAESESRTDADYRKHVGGRIARIGKSAGGLNTLAVPTPRGPRVRAQILELPTTRQLSRAAKEQPVGAFFAALAGLASVSAAVAAGAGVAVIGIGFIVFGVGAHGLTSRHPAAGALQTAMFGAFLVATAAMAPLADPALLAALAGGAGAIWVAAWSYNQDRPKLGVGLNALILGGTGLLVAAVKLLEALSTMTIL